MALAPGTKLGPYEIQSPLGAGGMGEVYRARDTKLGREVALKVLPEIFAADAQRMERFRREAQFLASLNHPNIASIYGLEDSSGADALVMELVEGPTLFDRIAAGAIPLDEALTIARQVCEGMEYAHERGIVHRDLKPANVKITPEGAVKILDFGLAKALAGDPASAKISDSPTISYMATGAGIILGTAAYMSPEQARAKTVDRRTDIWAFGCVLFEMLTGSQVFAGATVTDVLAAVVMKEPEWSLLPPNTHPSIKKLLQRCLDKDPKRRLRDIGEARIEIEQAIGGTAEPAPAASIATATSSRRELAAWVAAGVLALVAGGLGTRAWLAPNSPTAPAVVSQILPPPTETFVLGGYGAGPPVISPDGSKLAFSAIGTDGKQRLWVRPMNGATAQALAGTEDAFGPFWSPDSRSIGFFARDKLVRIDAAGGAPLRLADALHGRGGAWGLNGTILYAPNTRGPLYRVEASGGTPQQATQLDAAAKQIIHRWPQFLPDGEHFLYFAPSPLGGISTFAGSLSGGQPTPIIGGDSNVVYAPPGYLLFVRQGTLMAQRFDADKLRLLGDAAPLAEHADVNPNMMQAVFTVSKNGILAYHSGSDLNDNSALLWFDRIGKQIGETSPTGDIYMPALSPDGRKLAVMVTAPGLSPHNIWVYDLVRGIRTRLTFSPDPDQDSEPAWSPDGKSIVFISRRAGQRNICQIAADGSGSATLLLADDTGKSRPSFSPDGLYVVYQRTVMQTGSFSEIWALPLFGDRKPFAVVQNSQSNVADPAVSPDGRWLAYASQESGKTEVYIVPFLHGSGRWQVSTHGGTWPRWRRDGKELFYFNEDQEKVVSAEISAQGSALSIGQVVPLFATNPVPSYTWPYDVTADGKKFVVASRTPSTTAEPLTLLVNWPELLKK